MTFDDITGDGRLWAVKYEGEEENALFQLFDQWSDVVWLRQFFRVNIDDLISYFRITDVNKAIYDTLEDSVMLQSLIFDIEPGTDLESIFRPLESFRTYDMLLGREKARLRRRMRHVSWLRIYALKLSKGVYVVTGGAIKLTATMQERSHTLMELHKMEKVRDFLIEEGIVDDDSFIEYVS